MFFRVFNPKKRLFISSKIISGSNIIAITNRDSYDLKRDCRAREIVPWYYIRFDILHKWFEKFCVRSKADQRDSATLVFSGQMLKGKYDFYFRLDGVDFEKDYEILKN